MNARRVLTARGSGAVAVAVSALVVAAGIVGLGRSLAAPGAAELAVPVAAAILLVIGVLRLGGSASRAVRTPYW